MLACASIADQAYLKMHMLEPTYAAVDSSFATRCLSRTAHALLLVGIAVLVPLASSCGDPGATHRASATPAEVRDALLDTSYRFATERRDDDLGPGASLSGTVTSDLGDPLAGVEVCIVDDYSFQIREQLTKTDEHGQFAVPYVRPGKYRLAFCRAMRLPEVTDVFPLLDGDQDVIDRTVAVGFEISVQIVDAATSDPVSGAKVMMARAQPRTAYSVAALNEYNADFLAVATDTDALGLAVFEGLVPRSYDVITSAEGYANAVSAVTFNAEQRRLRVTLFRGGKIRGTVTNMAGAKVANATVVMARSKRSKRSSYREFRLRSVQTDSLGSYEIESVPNVMLHLLACTESGQTAFHCDELGLIRTKVAEGEVVQVNFVMPPFANVGGKITANDGQAVVGAKLRITATDFTPPRGSSFRFDGSHNLRTLSTPETVTDSAGRYHFQNVRSSWRPLEMEVEARGFSPFVVALDTRSSTKLVEDITLPTSTTALEGRITWRNGRPAEDMEVITWVQAGTKKKAVRARTDALGRFRLPVPKKRSRYDIKPTLPRDGAAIADPEMQFNVRPGQRADFVLFKPRVVQGIVVDALGTPIEEFEVTVIDVSNRVGRVETFAKLGGGRFRLSLLPRGGQYVVIKVPGLGDRQFDCTNLQDPVRIVMDAGRTLRGRLLTADGTPVAGELFALDSGFGVLGPSMPRANTTSSANGSFELEGAPTGAGQILVAAELNGRTALVRLPIEATQPNAWSFACQYCRM